MKRAIFKIALASSIFFPATLCLADYYSGKLKNHGHTSLAGDGGPLTNPVISGSINPAIVNTSTLNVTGTVLNQQNLSVSNRVFNGNFESWTNGATFNSPADDTLTADGWTLTHSNISQNITQDTTTVNTVSKQQGLSVLKSIGTGGGANSVSYIKQTIPNFYEYRGATVTFSVDWNPGNCSNCALAIDDGVSITTNPSIGSVGVWGRVSVTKIIASSASKVSLDVGQVLPDKPGITADIGYLDNALFVTGTSTANYLPGTAINTTQPVTVSSRTITNLTSQNLTVQTATMSALSGLRAASANGEALRFQQMKLVQWSSGTLTGSVTRTLTTFSVVGASCTIVPTSASNWIVTFAQGILSNTTSGQITYGTIARDATNLSGTGGVTYVSAGAANTSAPSNMLWIDKPGDTSSHIYAPMIRVTANSGDYCGSNVTCTTWCFELAP